MIALWAIVEPERLSGDARRALEDGPLRLSVVSYWEVTIKCMKGLLRLEPGVWWAEARLRLDARVLNLEAEHVAALQSLPPIHADPFDRALLAQAATEDLTLISSDRMIARYASPTRRILN